MVLKARGGSALDLRDDLEIMYSGNLWFRRANVSHDDGGEHVELHVTSTVEMQQAGAPLHYPGHRVCVIAQPRNAEEEAYASIAVEE